MRRFELVEGTSNKFWQIELSGDSFTVQFGRIGTAGQTQTKSFDSAEKAQKEHDKLVAEKVKKGYAEVGATASPVAVAPGRTEVGATASPVAVAPSKPASTGRTSTSAEASADHAEVAPRGASSSQGAIAPAVVPSTPASTEAASPAASPPLGASDAAARVSAAPTADEDGVFWTDALKKRVHVRRGGVDARVPALPPASKVWAEIKQAWSKRASAFQRTFEQRAPGREAIAQLAERINAKEPRAGSVEDDATLIAALAYHPDWQTQPEHEAPIEVLIAKAGYAHAVRATLVALERSFQNRDQQQREPVPELVMRADDGWTASFHQHGHLRGLPRLRALLAIAPEADYQEARDAAAELRASGTEAQRVAVSFLFPTEQDWVAGDLRLIANNAAFTCLLASVRDPAMLAGLNVEPNRLYNSRYTKTPFDVAASLIDGCGTGAADFLVRHPLSYSDAEQRRELWDTIAALGCDEAMNALAGALDQKEAQAALAESTARQPRRALRVLARRAAERGKAGEPARLVLGVLVRRSPEIVDEVSPALDAESRRAIEAIRAEQGGAVEDAAAADVPALLASPPWTAKKGRTAPPVVEGIAVAPPADAMSWAAGERESWRARTSYGKVERSELEWKLAAESTGHVDVATFASAPEQYGAAFAPRVQKRNWYDDRWYDHVAAKHELAALPFLEQQLAEEPATVLPTLLPYGAARLAPAMAEAFREKKSLRATARTWLLRHAEHAAAGLIAPALAKPGRTRTHAEAALRFLAQNGKEAVVLATAEQAGVRDAIAAVLAFDPLDLYPAKLPKLPSFVDARGLPRPVLAGGKGALPVEATEALLVMLAFSPPDEPYVGITIVKEVCDAQSLARFAWALFGAWLTNGAPSKEGWCMQALGHLGDDECARKLAQLVREWPGEAAHARAVSGLDVLAAIGTDVALMHLNGIALKVKFKGLQGRAEEKVQQIAEARGLTREELEDRLAPDLGLDEDGSLMLDFGPRQFRVGFDEQLRPFTKDASGSRLKDLPKPNKSDDVEKAKSASERWSQLKKDAKTTASQQILRLEMCMCGQRRFPRETFVELFVKHPLVFHIVRRLVWAVYDAEDRVVETFRVAEDRTFADANDDAWMLGEDARVGIPHPLELDADRLARWSQVFTDYEILQPFAQLGRPVYALADMERTAKKLDRVKGLSLPTGKVLGLEQRRWRRGAPQDGGVVCWMEKHLPGGKVAMLDLNPGLYTGMLSESPQQELGEVVVTEGISYWGHDRGIALGELSAIVFSELVRDLEGLRG